MKNNVYWSIPQALKEAIVFAIIFLLLSSCSIKLAPQEVERRSHLTMEEVRAHMFAERHYFHPF